MHTSTDMDFREREREREREGGREGGRERGGREGEKWEGRGRRDRQAEGLQVPLVLSHDNADSC